MHSRMLTLVLTLGALAAALAAPAPLHAQSMLDLLQSIRAGGGWVEIPIHDGQGTLTTPALPTAGMTLEGCLQVYAGQTGAWEIHARDMLGSGKLDLKVAPGEPRTFLYQPGPQGQLRVDAHWSEPRDTTLLLWVGLKTRFQPKRDACAPVYGDEDRDGV